MSQQFIPHKYQEDAIKWMLYHKSAGLFLPPGLGKTAITLSTFKILKQHNKVDRLLIISPLRVANIVWPNEIDKWSDFEHFTISVLHGPNKDYIHAMQSKDIYTINPDGLKWLFSKGLPGPKNARWMLVCDESTLFKNHSSIRFKLLKSNLNKFVCRYILTGTPIPNGMLQLWPQIFILDQGHRLGKFFTHYRNKYFYPHGYGGYSYAIVKDAEYEIYALIDDIVMHKTSDEIDLPPILYNTINIELDVESRTLYNDIKRHFIAEFGNDIVLTVNAAAASNKLKQISNGNMYVEDKIVHVHDDKINVIKEMVESLAGSPLLVMYEYLHDLYALQKAFPNAPHIGGGVKQDVLNKSIQEWNKGNIPVMFLQPAAGGHGLNLQDGGCHNVIWLSIPFDLELYIQANKRVHRQGVKNSVTIHHIVALNTIDEHIMKVLSGKSTLQNELLEVVKK